MKVLVTGAAGFIGSHLVEALLKQSHQVAGIDNFDPFYSRRIKEDNLKAARGYNGFQFHEFDLCHGESILQHLQAQQYKVVVHLAASAGVRPSLAHPMSYVRNNVEATVALMEAMVKTGHRRLVFASSSSVYGTHPDVPFVEEHDFNHALSVYAASKQSAEAFTRLYHNLYKFSVINLRFFTVYGPRQRPDLAIHKFFRAALFNEEIILFGDGPMARDYTYIEDNLQGILSAIGRVENHATPLYEIYNLGNHTPVTLHHLVEAIQEVSGRKCQILYRDIPLGDVPITYANIDRAKGQLGYSPKTPLREGLRKMYPWICSLYQTHGKNL